MLTSSSKILFYTKDLHGGTGRFLEHIQTELSKRKVSTRVLTHVLQEGHNVEAIRVGQASPKLRTFHFSSIKDTFINIFTIKRYIEDYKPDVIFSIDLYANLLISLIRPFIPQSTVIQSTHVNLIAHVNQDRSKIVAGMIWILIKSLYKFADIHITPSKGLRRQLIKNLQLPSHFVQYYSNFISVEKCQQLSDEKLENELLNIRRSKRVRLFSAGRFELQKDFEQLLYSVSDTFYTDKKVELYILGSGNQQRELMDICKRHNLENVYFLGWQSNPYKYLKYADIFLLITKYEAFPYSLLEALSLGLPVIASDVDFGPRELLGKNQYGLLLQNNKPESIVSAIKSLIYNKQLANEFKRKAKARAAQFDTHIIFPNYLKLFGIANNSSNTK